MSKNTQYDSPQFSQLVSWIKEENLQELRKFFPLKNMDIWFRRKYRSKYYSFIDIAKIRNEIYSELIDPLFIKPDINVKDLCHLFEAFLRDLDKRPDSEFKDILKKFYSGYKKIAPAATFPFSWILDPQKTSTQKVSLSSLMQKWENLQEEKDRIADHLVSLITKREKLEREKGVLIDDRTEKIVAKGLKIKDEEQIRTDEEYIQMQRESDKKIDLVEKISKDILNWLKIAKGKPGRRHEPFNVFVYHLINKNTKWKIDRDLSPPYVCKDGQHKLERDWKLILFLILDLHLRVKKLPELGEFISENKKRAARDALKDLKSRLWNTYKNFPYKDGWSFDRGTAEAGFRKLIVNDDGRFEIVML